MNNAQEKTKTCTKCDESKPLSAFSLLTKANGEKAHNAHCKECRNKASKQKNNKRKDEGNKYCQGCDHQLHVNNFASCKTNNDGLQTYCKDCKHKINQTHFSTFDGFINKLFLSLKHNTASRSKKLSIEITENDIKELYEKQKGLCALTGIKMTHLAYQNDISNRKINNHNISVDRINSSKGYTKDNVQLVCAAVNIMKSDFIEDDLLLLAYCICSNN